MTNAQNKNEPHNIKENESLFTNSRNKFDSKEKKVILESGIQNQVLKK